MKAADEVTRTNYRLFELELLTLNEMTVNNQKNCEPCKFDK